MKLIDLDEIRGEEILARAIVNEEYQELLSEGAVLKKEHIFKLKELGIREVFIKDDGVDAEDTTILKVDMTNKCKDKVKSIISKHIYNGNDSGMEEIIDTADKIIDDILENDDIVEQIYDIKERSSDIYEHSISTCSMAMIIALKMRLKQSLVHDIAVGCLLHDIGLRYITVEFEDIEPEDMIPKDHEEYCKHPVYGYSAVKDEEWLGKESKEIILGHHERLDGSGYPLHVTEMTIGTKIVALCDYFDEAICGIGRRRHKVHEVLEYIKAYSSIKFDKQVVEVLLDFTAVYPSKSTVITNDGSFAVVIRQNKGFPERPVLQLLSDKDGNKFTEPIVVDLLECTNVFIEKVIN